MDASNLEDMLFGVARFYDDFYAAEGDLLDDEMLDEPSDDELMLWEVRNELTLTQESTDRQFNEDLCNEKLPLDDIETRHVDAAYHGRRVRDRYWVIGRVEAMLESIIDGLLEDSETLTITLKSRGRLSRMSDCAIREVGHTPPPKMRNISLPGTSPQEAWKFAVLFKILELIHSSLMNNTIMTKRDIYYRHPDLFGKQAVVDKYVDDLACTFDITRAQLNVTAAAKGLLAGNFSIIRKDGARVEFNHEEDGALVPAIVEGDDLEVGGVEWIVVVEKEATFRSILCSPLWKILGSHGVILTAKGYPDIVSRIFLQRLADAAPNSPMYALVDMDPDGIAIMSTYKYGSYRLAHERVAADKPPGLSLPNIRWLGVQSQHISGMPMVDVSTKANAMPEFQGIMQLSPRDRAKAVQMLAWDLCTESGPEPLWRRELQIMLMMNRKAEMQILDELPGGLVSWLAHELNLFPEQNCELVELDSFQEDSILF